MEGVGSGSTRMVNGCGSRGQDIETILVNTVKPLSTKNTKISRVRWHASVVSTAQEAEAGESLEPSRQRLQ